MNKPRTACTAISAPQVNACQSFFSLPTFLPLKQLEAQWTCRQGDVQIEWKCCRKGGSRKFPLNQIWNWWLKTGHLQIRWISLTLSHDWSHIDALSSPVFLRHFFWAVINVRFYLCNLWLIWLKVKYVQAHIEWKKKWKIHIEWKENKFP